MANMELKHQSSSSRLLDWKHSKECINDTHISIIAAHMQGILRGGL